MGIFNVIKRLPLECLQWASSIVCIFLNLLSNVFLGAYKLWQWALKWLLHGGSSDAVRIIILGACNSGKSSLLYRIKLGEFIQTIATSSFIEEDCSLCHVCILPYESCSHNGVKNVDVINVRLCELGINDDNENKEEMLRYSSRILFVLDSTDTSVNEASMLCISSVIGQHNFYHQSPKYVIFNNKTDVAGSNQKCLLPQLKLPEHLKDRTLWINGSTLTGQGLVTAMRFILFDSNRYGTVDSDRKVDDLIQLY